MQTGGKSQISIRVFLINVKKVMNENDSFYSARDRISSKFSSETCSFVADLIETRLIHLML